MNKILNGHGDMRRRAGDAHVSASPASEIVESGGLCRPTIARDLELGARMIEWCHNGQQVNRHVDRAGNRRNFSRGQPASRVDAVSDDKQRAMTIGALADAGGSVGDCVVERCLAPGRSFEADTTDALEILREPHDLLKLRVERKQRGLVRPEFAGSWWPQPPPRGPVHVAAHSHAAADVEEDGEADRRIARVEVDDLCRLPSIEHGEIGFLEIANDSTVFSANRYAQGDEVDA